MSTITLSNFNPDAWRSSASQLEVELSDALKSIGVIVAEVDQATLNVSRVIEQSDSYVTGYLNTGAYFELTGKNFLSAPNLLSARFSGAGDAIYIEGNFPYKADKGTVSKIELSGGSSFFSVTGDLQYSFGNAFAASISGTLKTLTFRSPELELTLRGSLSLRSDEIVGGSLSFLDVNYGALDFAANGQINYSDSLKESLLSNLPTDTKPVTPVTPVTLETTTHSLDVIVDLFGQILYLKDLKETITSTNHTVEYGGTIFNWSEVDSFVTTVTRDDEFTDEFSREIVEAYPSVNGISYSTAVALVGAAAIDEILLAVAGADGNYVG